MKSFLIVLSVWAASSALGISSHRPVGTDYRILAEKYRKYFRTDDYQSAYDSASGSYLNLDPAKAPQEFDLQKLFLFVRDHRELNDGEHAYFARRIPWLYPYEGCWVRATIANQWAAQEKFTRPGKLFMFGNLKANTPNSISGSVSWWYHVAPVVRDGQGNLFVIDPAVNSAKPLTVEEELKAISYDAIQVKVAVCSPYTYEPFDNCFAESVGSSETTAQRQVGEYLSLEWSNLIELGRIPEKELGDEPPWQ